MNISLLHYKNRHILPDYIFFEFLLTFFSFTLLHSSDAWFRHPSGCTSRAVDVGTPSTHASITLHPFRSSTFPLLFTSNPLKLTNYRMNMCPSCELFPLTVFSPRFVVCPRPTCECLCVCMYMWISSKRGLAVSCSSSCVVVVVVVADPRHRSCSHTRTIALLVCLGMSAVLLRKQVRECMFYVCCI